MVLFEIVFLFTCSLFVHKMFSGHPTNRTNIENDVNHTTAYERINLENASQEEENHVYH